MNIPLCHKCQNALFALNVFCPHKSQTLMGCKLDSRITSYEKASILCSLLPPAIEVTPKRDIRTPKEWCDFFGVEIIDPDGWRGTSPSWNTRITRDMFKSRYQASTVRTVDKEKFKVWKHYLEGNS
jgi:hypothetical protein